MGLAIMVTAPLLFYILIFMCLKKSGLICLAKGYTKTDYLFLEVIFAIVTIFIYLMVKKDQYIYFWDYGREWRTAIIVKDSLLKTPMFELKNIYNSINTEDYNRFMPMLITLPLYLFGSSYKAFVVLVGILYLCPAIFVITLLIDKTIRLLDMKKPNVVMICLIVALTPILHYVLLNSFMDPPELMLVASVLALSIDIDYGKMNFSKDALIATCLLLSVLFRRHFAYFGVGFAVSQFLYFGLKVISVNKGQRKRYLLYFVCNMFLIGGIVVTVLLFLFKPFVIRSMFTDYSVKHRAWNQTLNEKLYRMVEVFGWIYLLIFMVIPLVYSIIKRKFNIVIPVLLNALVVTVLMWRVQELNYHQYYLIIVQVVLLFCIGVFGLSGKLSKIPKMVFNCFLQVLFGQSCKTFLDIVACPNWTKLQSFG